MKGKCAQLARRREPRRIAADFAGHDRNALETGVRSEKSGDLVRSFLRLERAGAVEQEPVGAHKGSGVAQQALLQVRHAGHVLFGLEPQNVGVPADGSGGRARRIEDDDIETGAGRPGRGIGGDEGGGQLEAIEIGFEPLEPGGRNIDSRHNGAARRKRGRLAAGSRAQISHRALRHIAGEAADQGGGRILHPPHAVAVAWQVLDPAVQGKAD